MDWIHTLNSAIAYIEDNLLGNITCEDIGGHIYISTFHFQRTFNLLTGMTVGEYIRKRRLSLAGNELTMQDVKIIDVALKYGYDTPESFSKAFRRFHGITPSQARKHGANLKSFNRLVIKIKLEGGSIMDYQIIEKEAFRVVAKIKMFTAETANKDLPDYWTEYFTRGLGDKVPGMFGICFPEEHGQKEFRYGIGCEESLAAEIPEGFEVIEIPKQTLGVFKCIGAMPDAIQDLLKKIYEEWFPQAYYELISGYDFEYYTAGDNSRDDYESEIWIPLKEK